MIRPSSYGFLIFKKDLESGMVIKKRYKALTEYWVYQKKESSLFGILGQKLKLQEKKDTFLYAIIVCDETCEFKEKDRSYLLHGIRFTEEDLKEYLNKTDRHLD